MARRFPHCSFGPYQLRRLLRAKLVPGETVVGWGSVERTALGPAKTMLVGLAMTPVIGPVLAVLLTHPRHRFLVLTDSRLIVLDTRKVSRTPRRNPARGERRGIGLHVVAETPIGAVAVRPTARKRVFRVALDDEDAAQSIEIPKRKGRSAQRMLDAFGMLAREDDAEINGTLPW